MIGSRLGSYRRRVQAELRKAFEERRPCRDVAASFAVGVFITTLPTLGIGVLSFFVIAYLFERASKLGMAAAVAVFNPVVKWGVYAASFWLGSTLLGPIPDGVAVELSLSAGPAVLHRLLVGNVLLAVVFSAVGYVVVLASVREFRRREFGVADRLPDAGSD